jgi:mRNA degradation ribonuclease J1/J2
VREYDESIIPDMIKSGFTMPVRASAKFKEQLDSLMALLPKEETVFIYSQFLGYILPDHKAYNANTDKFVHSHDWNHEYLHTSGHASRETLAQVCNLVNPHTAIIPIHTEKGSDFTSLDIPKELKNKVITNDTIVDDIEIQVR